MVSGALNSILAFFASAFGPSPLRSDSNQAAVAPTVSECFAPMASVNLPDASRVAADLDDAIALDQHKAYWPGYAPSESSNVITLKWNATLERFKPQYSSELAQGHRCCEAFGRDFARANYYLCDESGGMDGKRHLRPVKAASTEEGLDLIAAHCKSDQDATRITEIAHQGHLVSAAQEVASHAEKDGRYQFFQKEGSVRHEIIANGGNVVTVRSFVEYELKDVTDEGALLQGFSAYAVINTRIGFAQGKLDHEALGTEKTNMAFEFRYEKSKSEGIDLATLRSQAPEKSLIAV